MNCPKCNSEIVNGAAFCTKCGTPCQPNAAGTPAPAPRKLMTMVNTESIVGFKIVEVKGIAQGNTVRAKNFMRDMAAGLKNMVGGELKGYTELLSESRAEAVMRMQLHADSMGANAIVNVRFATSAVASGASEIFAYGTAVVIAPID